MLRLAARVLAVAACLAGGAGASLDPSAAPATTPTPASPLRCNASQGVHFQHSLQEVNGTSRTILKVLIKDTYNATLPPAPPTTPPPPPTATLAQLTTTLPPTKTIATPPAVTMPWDSSFESTSPNPMDTNIYSSYEDWDYLEESMFRFHRIHSKEDERILANERFRHQDRPPTHLFGEIQDRLKFCADAAIDDEEPIMVSDGSFHPRYEEVPGVGVYRLHARARTWEEARKTCEREGAQLAVPNSREEASALTEIHNRCPHLLSTHFNDYQYLGVHDLYSEGNWETIVGYPLNETGYFAWLYNQPDNAHHHGENCLTLNRHGFFNDVPCWTELPFICEHP